MGDRSLKRGPSTRTVRTNSAKVRRAQGRTEPAPPPVPEASPTACVKHGWLGRGGRACADCAEERERAPAVGASAPEPEEVESWLTGAEVVQQGASSRQLARWTEAGTVRRAKDKLGSWRYAPADVEIAMGAGKRGLTSDGRDEILEQFRQFNAQLSAHTLASFRMVHDPAHRVLELLERTNASLAAQNERYERRHLEMLKIFEQLMTAQHHRELEQSRVQAVEARRDKAFDKLSEAAPRFIEQLLATLAGKSLLAEIDDQQLQVLTVAEFLSDKQRGILAEELKRREARKPKASPSSANGAPNGGQ